MWLIYALLAVFFSAILGPLGFGLAVALIFVHEKFEKPGNELLDSGALGSPERDEGCLLNMLGMVVLMLIALGMVGYAMAIDMFGGAL